MLRKSLLVIAALFISAVGVSAAGEVKDGMEVDFVEGKGAPRPIKGYVWCLVTKPATYKTVDTTCLVRPATNYTKCVPAQYAWTECKVMVCPPKKVPCYVPPKFKKSVKKVQSCEEMKAFCIIPAEYKWVEKEVDTCKPYTIKTWVPAVYKTEKVKIMVKPPMRSCGEVKCGNKDGDVCMGAECSPAEYQTIEKQVLVTEGREIETPFCGTSQKYKVKVCVKPAQVKETVIPAKYAEIECMEMCETSEIQFKEVPAVYKTVKKLCMVKPESTVKVDVPAKYETRQVKCLDMPETMVWRLVKKDCDEPAKPAITEGCATDTM